MSGYAVQIDHLIYDGYTLVTAMREVYGVGNAKVLRGDTTVVSHAGSAYSVTYAPTGRDLIRRKAR